MVIKMPKMSKAEQICALLAYWDPLQMGDKAGYRFYNYEAEVIAQSLRSNSKPETISKLVHELIEKKMVEEGVELGIDQGSYDRIAEAMIATVKKSASKKK